MNPVLPRRVMLLLPMLAACAQDAPPRRTSFPSLRYEYLTKLRLNVASIDVDQAPPAAPGTLEALAPVRPAVAVRTMAQDRLVPGGGVVVYRVVGLNDLGEADDAQ